MRITFISDTHNKHNQVTHSLPGGDLLIHAGDLTGRGYQKEITDFLNWYNGLDNYTHKIFIAGNHDWGFQESPDMCRELLKLYPKVTYLQDNLEVIGEDYESAVKIYGSPWQPEFYDWAFNLRRGLPLAEKWALIPEDTDVLITHGPPKYMCDYMPWDLTNIGCQDLLDRIMVVKPKLNVFGHIHVGYGYKDYEGVLFVNASTCNEEYQPVNNPIVVEYNEEKFDFI